MKLYFCYSSGNSFIQGKSLIKTSLPDKKLNVYAVIELDVLDSIIDQFIKNISSDDAPYSDSTLSTPIDRPVGVTYAILKSILDSDANADVQYTSWCASSSDDAVVKTVRTMQSQNATLRLTRIERSC